jgi:excisionase family DNA binding protein
MHRQTTTQIKTERKAEAQSAPLATVMTVQQASEYLGLAVSTLNQWRCHGGGPVFIKMGRAVRYRVEDLEAFISSSRMSSTSI